MDNDLISRSALQYAFDNLCCHDCKKCRNFKKEDSFYKCDLIDNVPTVEQPQGEWIYFLGCGVGRAMCSECGQLGDIKKYCGYCGAKMKLG